MNPDTLAHPRLLADLHIREGHCRLIRPTRCRTGQTPCGRNNWSGVLKLRVGAVIEQVSRGLAHARSHEVLHLPHP